MEYRLLGPVEVVGADGRALPVHGAKLQGLVTLLALDVGRVVSSARLVAALYGDPYPRVENALQQLVSKLRRVLAEGGAPDRLHTRAPGYVLDEPAEAVDALRFEAAVTTAASRDPAAAARMLREASGLWRGAVADGATLEGGSAAVRTRLTELRDAAVEDRVDCELRLGLHSALVAELEAMVAATPLRERRWGQLMVALYRSGRQSDALRVYRSARRTLAEELGVEPGPQLRALEAAVLAHDEALLLPPPAAVPSPAPPAAPAASSPPDRSATPPPPRSAAERPVRAGRIRRPRTPCVGRAAELDELTRLVEQPGLTTLVGPGGVGKTRLAVEVAEGLHHRLADGVRWVELTPVTPHGVGEAVGRAVGFDDTALARDGDDLVEALAAFLAPRRIAVVLDNCEHLVHEVAAFVAELMDLVPDLWVLATSREGLAVEGEVLFPVPPLSSSAAVELFVERARAGGVQVAEVDATPGGVVADICRRLDQLPLAVELAAGRARHLGLAGLDRGLDRRFDVLTVGPRTAVARQRTLRAVIDWSYALLDAREQDLFARLAVFEGGFSLAAAEAVDAESSTTLDVLAGLVDKSLVTPAHDGAETRYHLLETLRQYGLEQLGRSPGAAEVRRAHRDHFVGLAAAAEAGLLTSADRGWRRTVEVELPNLRAASRSAIAVGAWDDALRIASRLWWFWGSTDRHREGREWLEEALRGPTAATTPALRAKALVALGYIAGQQQDLDVAIAAGEEGLALTERSDDELATASARQALGLTMETAGSHDRSVALLAAARRVWDAAGVHQRVMANDIITCVRALAAGDLETVDAASREVLRRCALVDYEPHRCWAYIVRVRLAEARGDLATAAAEGAAAVASARRLDLAHFVSFALAQHGRIAALRGDAEAAEATLSEAVDVADAAGAGWFGAMARVELAEVRRANGDRASANALLRQVVEWSRGPVAGAGRVTFYRRIAGDPVAAAVARLADDGGPAPAAPNARTHRAPAVRPG